MVLGDLFFFSVIFLPVHPHFYPTTTVLTRPNANDGWTGLCIKLCYQDGLSLRYGGQTDLPPLLTTWGDSGPGLVAIVYYYATYLFVLKMSYVVIMSVHVYQLIVYFLWCLRVVNDFFFSVTYMCSMIFTVYACGHVGSC